MSKIIIAIAALAATSGPLSGQTAADLAAQIDPWFATGMATEHIPGAAFALVQNGKITVQKGYGVIDVSTRRPVSPSETIWPFGSIAKVVTATAVAQLADRGRVAFDADANHYLRSVKLPASSEYPFIRVRDLLTHTNALDELPGRGATSRDAVRPLREFLAGKLVRFDSPRRITRYSSYGLATAGLLVEDVSTQPFDRYVADNIFRPLGMRNTSMRPAAPALSEVATPYEVNENEVQRAAMEWHHTIPSSTLFSTVTDMARFAMAHLASGSAILSDSMTTLMQSQQATIHPRIPGWGFGWQLANSHGLRVVEHGGDIGGFAALLVLLPDIETGFVIVSHIEGSSLRFQIRDRLIAYFAKKFGMQPGSVTGITGQPRPELAGEYLANNYCRSCAGGAANAQRFNVTANPDGSLTLWDTKWLPTVDSLLFVSEDSKRTIGFMLNDDGTPAALSAGAWRVLEPAPKRK